MIAPPPPTSAEAADIRLMVIVMGSLAGLIAALSPIIVAKINRRHGVQRDEERDSRRSREFDRLERAISSGQQAISDKIDAVHTDLNAHILEDERRFGRVDTRITAIESARDTEQRLHEYDRRATGT